MKTKLLQIFILAVGLNACGLKPSIKPPQIIPVPVEISLDKGGFRFDRQAELVYNSQSLDFLAAYAASLWEPLLGFRPEILEAGVKHRKKAVLFHLFDTPNPEIGDEGYVLEINNNELKLSANTEAGILYGIHTVEQLLDSEVHNFIPAYTITDYPRFAWRGLHLDVSRHFMPVDFIFRMLDLMAMHKLNLFHWHLIDDQGWRLEIVKYPKLTEVGAWRVHLPDVHWNDRPLINDPANASYGGFYTQDEVRQVVAYASKLNITVMPEIEMPAHVMSALAAYPRFSCTGENLGVPPGGVWPITHIYCAGNDSTFVFLEDVLTEVMELFPSEFIHIGGDEADKTNWKACPKCQSRMKAEGLKDEEELQSWFIRRIGKFLEANGRKLIGWDEILEGGLAPGASVMSWRGEAGGIEAARMGHTVVMTPGSHCYFDHYQGDPSIEPLAIGGFTTLKKVYHYEPIPEALSPEEAKLVLGAQANVWTEYMPVPEHVEYMVFPRLAALAEVLWSPAGHRDWAGFSQRMKTQYRRYDRLSLNYARSAFQVAVEPVVDAESGQLLLSLSAQVHDPEIRYTLDGSEPSASSPLYTDTLRLEHSAQLKAAVFEDGQSMQLVLSRFYDLHLAFAAGVFHEFPPSPRYPGKGPFSLVDGVRGTTYYNDGNWSGFLGNDMVATIDLGKPQNITSIAVDALQDYTSWIFFPKKARFEVSDNGIEFSFLGEVQNQYTVDEPAKITQLFTLDKAATDVRYIRVHLENIGQCPPGHSGEGKNAWLFVSEVVVR